jgi:hypothetical protein
MKKKNRNNKKMEWENYSVLILPKKICKEIQRLGDFVPYYLYDGPYNDFLWNGIYVMERLEEGEIGIIGKVRIVVKK